MSDWSAKMTTLKQLQAEDEQLGALMRAVGLCSTPLDGGGRCHHIAGHDGLCDDGDLR